MFQLMVSKSKGKKIMKSVYALTSLVLATTLVTADLQAQSPRNRPERETTISAERETTTSATTRQTNVNIQQEIQTQITSDPLLRGARIEVVEEGDTIILKGKVDSERAYERALTIAYSIEGVKTVEVNELEVVCPKRPSEDLVKAARVRGILISEGIVPAEFVHREFVEWPVHVLVTDGVVTVAGFVESDEIRTRISTRFRSVPEIGSVRVNVRTDAARGRVDTRTTTGVTSTTDTQTGVTSSEQGTVRGRSGASTTTESATQRDRTDSATTQRGRSDSATTQRGRSSETATQRGRSGDSATQRGRRDETSSSMQRRSQGQGMDGESEMSNESGSNKEQGR